MMYYAFMLVLEKIILNTIKKKKGIEYFLIALT